MGVGQLSESDAVDALRLPFIVRAIPQGHMVGGISLIWAIPIDSIFWVLLAWGRFGVTKAIIPDGPEHFLTPSAHRDTHLFGGLGVNNIWQNVKGGESDHGRP